jgi:hypothetical protein
MSTVSDRYAFGTLSGTVNGIDIEFAALMGYVLPTTKRFCCAYTFNVLAKLMSMSHLNLRRLV